MSIPTTREELERQERELREKLQSIEKQKSAMFERGCHLPNEECPRCHKLGRKARGLNRKRFEDNVYGIYQIYYHGHKGRDRKTCSQFLRYEDANQNPIQKPPPKKITQNLKEIQCPKCGELGREGHVYTLSPKGNIQYTYKLIYHGRGKDKTSHSILLDRKEKAKELCPECNKPFASKSVMFLHLKSNKQMIILHKYTHIYSDTPNSECIIEVASQ